MAPSALVDRGMAALEACAWQTAEACFAEALAREETAAALDGLGQARYWLGKYQEALALRERAYAAYRREQSPARAGITAVQLAMLHGLVNGSGAAVSGWLAHARRALAEAGDGTEQGWVLLFEACITADPDERERLATAAADIGRRWHQPALEYDALCYVGKAHVERDAVDLGMGLVDEAVAALTCGLVTDPWATAEILCTLYHACEIAVDIARAEEWLGLVDDHVRRTGELPVFGVCRCHYGGLLVAAGRWPQAEKELQAAVACYEAGYRGTRHEPLLRLADLRARQGRLADALEALEGYEDLGDAALPRARVHLARGESAPAAFLLERYVDSRGHGMATVSARSALVEALIAGGRLDDAASVADALADLSRRCPHPPVQGFAAASQARVAAAAGDLEAARDRFQRALASFAAADLRGELAVARLDLAVMLADIEPAVAQVEAEVALGSFRQRGALRDAEAAAQLVRRLSERSSTGPPDGLTRRERQVLELVAAGSTNTEIAAELFISPRTAEHHVGNILRKLGVRNRAEAAAHVTRTPLSRIRA